MQKCLIFLCWLTVWSKQLLAKTGTASHLVKFRCGISLWCIVFWMNIEFEYLNILNEYIIFLVAFLKTCTLLFDMSYFLDIHGKTTKTHYKSSGLKFNLKLWAIICQVNYHNVIRPVYLTPRDLAPNLLTWLNLNPRIYKRLHIS